MTPVQTNLLSELAIKLNKTKAELIREGINLMMRKKISDQEDPLLSLIGQAGYAGKSDISERHDAYLTAQIPVRKRKNG